MATTLKPVDVAVIGLGATGGVAVLPLARAGLKIAGIVGVNSILMMNDPDESRRLAMQNPAGGIVSLHELPDFIRLVRATPWKTSA